jgi:glucose-1-phosphate adenylyltransferase
VAYEFNGYWKDVGTLGSYWEANMELIDIIPEFNLYEEFWKIYTKNEIIPPQYISSDAKVYRSLIGDGCEVYGEVQNSIIGCGVTIGKGAVIRDSIVMQGAVIQEGAVLDRAIVAENAVIGQGARIGFGEALPNKVKPAVYSFGLAVIAENTVIPPGVKIGRNTAVTGRTEPEDYPDGELGSGETLDKAGVVS